MSLIAGYWMPEDGRDDIEQEMLESWLSALGSGGEAGKLQRKALPYGAVVSHQAAHAQDFSQSFSLSLSASGLKKGDCNPSDISVFLSPQTLVLRRHRLGRCGLFWKLHNRSIAFSNRLMSLTALMDNPQISRRSVYAFSCFSYLPAPLTPLEGIHQVEAGVEVSFDRSLSHLYNGTPSFGEVEGDFMSDEHVAVAHLRALLEEAVSTNTTDVSGREVGVFLSGGLDSSLTAAMLHRAGCKVRCFVLDFGEFGITEMSFAESVCEHLGLPLQKVDARPQKIKRELPGTIEALDMPFGDGVTVPLFLLAQEASRQVDTVFNGEGGDQLFAGWTNKPMIASSIYGENGNNGAHEHAFINEYFKTFHRFHGHEERTFSQAFLSTLSAGGTVFDELCLSVEAAIDPRHTSSLLHRLRRANLMLKGAQNIQPRATNIAAHFGLNLRSLFCYEPLVEWTFRVSPQLYLKGAHEKYLLKRAVEEWLPQAVVWREKRGMGVPLTEWLLGPLRRETWRWLNPAVLAEEGIFREDLPDKIGTGRFSGLIVGRRIGEMLWLLLSWQAWRCRALGTNPPAKLYNPFWLRRNPLEE